MAELKHDYDAVVIGGGASGIVAAISARRSGASVLICEKMPQLGKKLLATGAGRCNLINDRLDASFYNQGAGELVSFVFGRFGREETLNFFKELGLFVYSDNGKVYPVTNQAASVMEVLEAEITRLKIDVQCNCEVAAITRRDGAFKLTLRSGKNISAQNVILCAGAKSYPAFGSEGKAYGLASGFGHKVIEPVPVAVPLVVKDPWCHILQGQRIRAAVTGFAGGKMLRRAEGDLLFTKYGLSGTAILDISDEISIALNRTGSKDVSVTADLVPFISDNELRRELLKRLDKKLPAEKMLMGLLPPKFSKALHDVLGRRDPDLIIKNIKNRKFVISGTRGWNEAEFTAGGVDAGEVDPQTLESKRCKGLYLAGEMLDVHGCRGGYNLAWAWASGYIAGASAAKHSLA